MFQKIIHKIIHEYVIQGVIRKHDSLYVMSKASKLELTIDVTQHLMIDISYIIINEPIIVVDEVVDSLLYTREEVLYISCIKKHYPSALRHRSSCFSWCLTVHLFEKKNSKQIMINKSNVSLLVGAIIHKVLQFHFVYQLIHC